MAGKNRPILIAVIAILTIIVAILVILGGVGLIALEGGALGASGAVALLVGIVILIVGIALWSGWTIAWYLGVIIHAVSIIFSLYTIVTAIMDGADVTGAVAAQAISLIISGFILFYLFRPKVKVFFGVGK